MLRRGLFAVVQGVNKMQITNIPVCSTKSWAIVNSNEPWTFPSFVRMSISAAWEAFQLANGQGNVSIGDFEDRGYRAIEVLIAPIEPYVQRRKVTCEGAENQMK